MLTRLKEYIDNKGISVSAFEKSIGMSNASFGKSLKNNGAIGSDKLENILKIYPDINAEWLLTGKGKMLKSQTAQYTEQSEGKPLTVATPDIPYGDGDDIQDRKISVYRLKTDYYNQDKQLIPLFDINASAGLALLFSNQNTQIPLDHIMIPNAPKCDGALYIRGDSMYPILKAGDIGCYKIITSIDNIIFGEKYILDLDNGDDQYLTVKYVQKSEKGNKYIKLVSENKHHADREISVSTIRAMAIVKISIRYDTLS